MNWPGNVLPIQAERGDKKLARKFCALKKQPGPFLRENERQGLACLEGRIFRHSDFHQVAIISREEGMKNGVIERNELKLLRGALSRSDRFFRLEAQLVQEAFNRGRHAID